MLTISERRQAVAKCLKVLRAYRKGNRLCRECGEPLGEQDKTRCFNCRVKHSTNQVAAYQLKIREGRRKNANA